MRLFDLDFKRGGAGIGIFAGCAALTLPTGLVAQERTIVPTTFGASLKANDAQLLAVEKSLAVIERAKTDAAKDALAPAFEQQQMAYAEGMVAKYKVALGQADLASKTRGAGSIEALNLFEKVAVAHERRLTTLSARGARMKPANATSSLYMPRPYPAQRQLSWGDRVVEFVIPSARAAIALRVYNICNGNVQSAACIAAVAKGVQDGVAAKNTFDACWAKYAKTKPAFWRATLRAGCTTALAVRLA